MALNRTQVYFHPACYTHDTGAGHPEAPGRLRAIENLLRSREFSALSWQEAPSATLEQLSRAHPLAYVERTLAAIPDTGSATLDDDTIVSPGSKEAALRSAGAVCAAVDAVLAGATDNAFCLIRPPGHHAERAKTMGFCLFNNIAVGAAHALARGLERVAIIDFDVHHGNGTQDICHDWPGCLYISTHQSPLYPGTGKAEERGGHGNIVNLPLRPRSGGKELRQVWLEQALPALEAQQPQLVFISAGFDAHTQDPLASLYWREEDYTWITEQLFSVAQRYAHGRIVSALEGGYDLRALGESCAAHVRVLLGLPAVIPLTMGGMGGGWGGWA